MIKKLLCWLGLHYWLIAKRESWEDEDKLFCRVYAGCVRCAELSIVTTLRFPINQPPSLRSISGENNSNA